MTRREWMQVAGSAVMVGLPATLARAQGQTGGPNRLEVWKSASCGCCGNWVTHMTANGFTATVHNQDDVTPIKRRLGVPRALESCHTAVVDGIVLEGQVPADTVRQLQSRRQANAGIVGLAVPGMPIGAPGMEQGGRQDKYDVIAFDRRGLTSVFASR